MAGYNIITDIELRIINVWCRIYKYCSSDQKLSNMTLKKIPKNIS